MDLLYYDIVDTEKQEFPIAQKNEEEIKKLILDDDMDENSKAIYLLTKGQPIQQAAVYSNLHNAITDDESFKKIVPVIKKELAAQNEQTQIECAKGIVKLLSEKNVKFNSSQLEQLYQIWSRTINAWDKSVLDEWALVIDEILKKIDYQVIENRLSETILELSEQSRHSMNKYIAATTIGIVAKNKVGSNEQIFERARVLCQDVNPEVRQALAQITLKNICIICGTDIAEIKFLDKILGLVYDSDMNTKLYAIDSLIEIIPILSKEILQNKIISVLIELMQSANSFIMQKMSFSLGDIVYKVEGILMNCLVFLATIQAIYKEWLQNKESDIRYNAIYNLPYMIKFYEDKEPLKLFYLSCLEDLDSNIKYCAVSQFDIILEVFQNQPNFTLFKETIEDLFQDSDNGVKSRLVLIFPRVYDIWMNFSMSNSQNKDKKISQKKPNTKQTKDKQGSQMSVENQEKMFLLELVQIFGDQILESHMWRLEIEFMKGFKKCQHHFDYHLYIEYYFNFLIERIQNGMKDVKEYAIQDFMEALQKNFLTQITKSTLKKNMANRFSRKFLKHCGFTETAISLGSDKLKQVRIRFASHAILIRKAIANDDLILLSKFNEVLRKLCLEKDKDVSDEAFAMQQELSSYTKNWYQEIDQEDSKRNEQEEKLHIKEDTKRNSLKDTSTLKPKSIIPLQSNQNSSTNNNVSITKKLEGTIQKISNTQGNSKVKVGALSNLKRKSDTGTYHTPSSFSQPDLDKIGSMNLKGTTTRNQRSISTTAPSSMTNLPSHNSSIQQQGLKKKSFQ